MSQKKAKEILKKIDPEVLQTAMSDVISAAFTGQPLPTVIVQVELKIPKGIHDMVVDVCRAAEVNENLVFSEMASHGFQTSIESVINMGQSVKKETNPAEETSSQLNDVMSKMGQFGQMLDQLKNVQKMAEDYGIINNQGKNNKDHK